AGLLDHPSLEPLQGLFPARLPRGLLAHNGILRFPLRSYFLDNVYLLEDRFDIALGAVNVRTGEVIGNLLHRALIGQDLIFALFRVEPRTPTESFHFRGPAGFLRGADGKLRYRYDSAVLVPYPEGFKFPERDLATGIIIGPNSRLDPYAQ